ncbi:hypothetical protein M413DRAFT_351351 [Hebeloma cylindrosporum]|uniref:Uncharacterized protein n=1 Tax=Hebeloma cylindrosporum TaxID=76867 RepID=A0A0C3BV49_HEBCY|nr:hypothetical protein M413DRAFT_351351 [Hebeloma cylindrosporum h7]
MMIDPDATSLGNREFQLSAGCIKARPNRRDSPAVLIHPFRTLCWSLSLSKELPNPPIVPRYILLCKLPHLLYSFKMVHAASAVAFAVAALNVASTMANPTYDNSNDLMEREFTDFDVDARDFYDDLDAREYEEFDAREFAEIEARDLFQQLSELDARDYDEIDAREYEEVYNYLRAVSSSVSASITASATSTASPALKTITKTKTFVPKATACTQSELRAKKLAKKLAHEKAKQAKKAKAAARRAKKLLEKKAKEDAKKRAKNAKKGKHSTTTTSSSTSVTHTSTSTSTSSSATSSSPVHPTHVAPGAHHVAAAHITPAPKAKAVAHENISRTTVTGKHGTVTVRVTTTAAQPACTRAGKFRRIFKHHKEARNLEEDDLFAREYAFDQLD